jgi:hypothetical protein
MVKLNTTISEELYTTITDMATKNNDSISHTISELIELGMLNGITNEQQQRLYFLSAAYKNKENWQVKIADLVRTAVKQYLEITEKEMIDHYLDEHKEQLFIMKL